QRRLAVWQARNGRPEDEALLIEAARARLCPADERRLKRLIAKSERGTLSARERADYQALAQQSEQLDLVRVEAVAEVARRRGRTAAEVLAELTREGNGDGT